MLAMTEEVNAVDLLDQMIARLIAEFNTLDEELRYEARKGLEDWLLVEACKRDDSIELEPDTMLQAHRKRYQALQHKKCNTEKIIVALQTLRGTSEVADGERLFKQFQSEAAKYA